MRHKHVEQAEFIVKKYGNMICHDLPEGWQFALLLVEEGVNSESAATYVSNGSSKEMSVRLIDMGEALMNQDHPKIEETI